MSGPSNNISRVGFIDVLTGFLCSAALLMIIIAYSRDSGGDIAGGPRDYLYYQIRVRFNDINLDPSDARLQFYITTPENQLVANRINADGNIVQPNNFFHLTDQQDEFYVWGPSYDLSTGSNNEVLYNIYGVTTTSGGENWQIDALYYDHKNLENGLEMSAQDIKQILDANLQVKVFSKTLKSQVNNEWRSVKFGNVSKLDLPGND